MKITKHALTVGETFVECPAYSKVVGVTLESGNPVVMIKGRESDPTVTRQFHVIYENREFDDNYTYVGSYEDEGTYHVLEETAL